MFLFIFNVSFSGNSYNIENLKKTNAYLQFVQIKG